MRTTIIVIALLFLSGCYDYYIASRTPDRATQTDWLRGSYRYAWTHDERVDSGQWHIYYQEWNGYEEEHPEATVTQETGDRFGIVGRYFTDCPEFTTCGIPDELLRR